ASAKCSKCSKGGDSTPSPSAQSQKAAWLSSKITGRSPHKFLPTRSRKKVPFTIDRSPRLRRASSRKKTGSASRPQAQTSPKSSRNCSHLLRLRQSAGLQSSTIQASARIHSPVPERATPQSSASKNLKRAAQTERKR